MPEHFIRGALSHVSSMENERREMVQEKEQADVGTEVGTLFRKPGLVYSHHVYCSYLYSTSYMYMCNYGRPFPVVIWNLCRNGGQKSLSPWFQSPKAVPTPLFPG